jgi:hypothetical protein
MPGDWDFSGTPRVVFNLPAMVDFFSRVGMIFTQ